MTSGGRTASYTYDAYGRTATSRDASGRVTQFQYDVLNRQRFVTTPDAGTTEFVWGPVFLNQVNDPRQQGYQWTYNALGQVEREVRPSDATGQNLTTEYDRYGRVSATTNRRGQRVTYSYDGWDRPATRTADGETTTFSYSPDSPDPNAPVWVAVSNPESTDTVRMDAKGRVTSSVSIRSIGGIGQTQRFELAPRYDANDRPVGLAVIEPDGTRDSTGYSYDPSTQQVSSLYDFGRGTTTFGYDRDGLPHLATLPNASTVSQGYTSTHMVNGIRYGNTALDAIAGVVYEYDNLNRIQRRLDGGLDTKREFTYDPAGGWLSGFGDYTLATTSTHPTCTTNENGTVCTDPVGTSWSTTANETFAYDKSANPTDRGAVPAAGNRLAQFNGFTLAYDADGNLVSKTGNGITQTFGWSSLGELTSVTTNGTTVEYRYDGLGRRVRKLVAMNQTGYLYDGEDLLLEYDPSGVQAKYTYYPGSGDAHSVARGASTYYFATDVQGSVLAVFDSTGQVVGQYAYAPFGEVQAASETVPNRIRYAGREFETETGLYYNDARWYDPQLHRFISEDPIGIDGGINLYAYTGNDPVNFVDPGGTDMMANKCVENLMSSDPNITLAQAKEACKNGASAVAALVARARRRQNPTTPPDPNTIGRVGAAHAPVKPSPQVRVSGPEVPWWVEIIDPGNGRTPEQRRNCAIAVYRTAASGFGDILFLSGINDAFVAWRGSRVAVQSAMGLAAKNVPGQLAATSAAGNAAILQAVKLSGWGVGQNAVLTMLDDDNGWKAVPLVGTSVRFYEAIETCKNGGDDE